MLLLITRVDFPIRLFPQAFDESMLISSIISNLATAEGQYRHTVDYKQKRPKLPHLYLLIFLEIELEVKSIEFLIFLGFGIEASISFALHTSRVSRPFILPLNP